MNTFRTKLMMLAVLMMAMCTFAPAQNINPSTSAWYKFPTQSATGAGASIALHNVVPHKHAVQVNVTGSPASCTGTLQGSLDDITYFDLTTSITCTSNTLTFATDKPVLFVRPNITALSGGSSPTVTFIYAGVR